jgi:hypothetical protein
VNDLRCCGHGTSEHHGPARFDLAAVDHGSV